MVGILLITHDSLGASLLECAAHVMGGHPENVAVLAIRANDDPALLLQQARNLVTSLERGGGVLVMSDMFGATPSNIARRLLEPGKVEGLAGANLPMLVRR